MTANSITSMQRLKALIFFVILAILAYWQLALMQNVLKWDMLDQVFQWKYFIGECLQHHLLPYWNPYQDMGYPIHADPQSTSWYPITWFLGYFFGYSIYTFSADFIIHIIIAAYAMYYLATKLDIGQRVALLMGVAYMMSGFFVSNAQHFSWMTAAAWMPFLLAFFISLSEHQKAYDAILLGLTAFMMLSGGYPGLAFILLYLLLALFVYYFISKWVKKQAFPYTYLLLCMLSVLVFVSTAAVYLVSVSGAIPFLDRAEGLPLETAMFNPFTLRACMSFLFPYASVKDAAFLGTDISMANAYMGLVISTAAIVSLFVAKPTRINVIFGFGILSYLAALGPELPVRAFLFHYLPFLDMFRFPSIFRLFGILGFIVSAGWVLHYYSCRQRLARGFLYTSLLVFVVLLLLLFFSRFSILDVSLDYLVGHGLFVTQKSTTTAQHFVFQGIIQAVLLLLLLFFYYRFRYKTAALIKVLLVFTILEMGLALQLNAPYTIYTKRFTARSVDEFASSLPQGFPIPKARPVAMNYDRGKYGFGPLWKNLNILQKQIAWDGYNPFILSSYELLSDSLTELHKHTISQLPVFIADTLLDESQIHAYDFEKYKQKKAVFVNGISLYPQSTAKHTSDSARFVTFKPYEMDVEAYSSRSAILVLQQNYYPGWRAMVNGENADIILVNKSLIGLRIPSGMSKVKFIFKPEAVSLAFSITCISVLIWLTVLVVLFYVSRKHTQRKESESIKGLWFRQ